MAVKILELFVDAPAQSYSPGITAYAGIFFGLQGFFGTINRPLVLIMQDSALISTRSSLNPVFYPNQL